MAKVKYYYDSETLSYRPISSGKGLKISNLLLFLISSLLFGIIALLTLLNTSVIKTPKEILQDRELRNYKLQFELLNRRISQMQNVLTNIEERDDDIYRIYFSSPPKIP